MWAEYSETSGPCLRVFCEGVVRREETQIIIVESSQKKIIVSLAVAGSPVESLECADFCTVRAKCVFEKTSEDWTDPWSELRCRLCDAELATSELDACLLPSATWGFEDMRVCEECGPLTCGRKRGRKNFFLVDQFSVYFRGTGCGCGTLLDGAELERIKTVAGWESCVKFSKHKIIGPHFLSFYSEFSAGLWEAVNEPGRAKVIAKDVVLVTEQGVRPGVRILLKKNDELLQQNGEVFVLPSEFSPGPQWSVAVVAVPPVLVDR